MQFFTEEVQVGHVGAFQNHSEHSLFDSTFLPNAKMDVALIYNIHKSSYVSDTKAIDSVGRRQIGKIAATDSMNTFHGTLN